MSLKNIVISTLAGIGLAGTLACGDVHNPYESANGDNSGSSSGSCGNSPFVGRYLWAMEGCEIGTTTPISPSTCQARLEGDVREGCYMSVDGTSIHLTCDGEYWGRISTQQVPGCPGYFFFIEDGYINFFSDQPWPGYRQCQDSPEFNNSCAECQDSPEFNSSCAE